GVADELPARSPRRAKRIVRVACVAVERAGRVLLVRRPAGTLLGGTWTLPAVQPRPRESDPAASRPAPAQPGLPPSGAGPAAWGRRAPSRRRARSAMCLRIAT